MRQISQAVILTFQFGLLTNAIASANANNNTGSINDDQQQLIQTCSNSTWHDSMLDVISREKSLLQQYQDSEMLTNEMSKTGSKITKSRSNSTAPKNPGFLEPTSVKSTQFESFESSPEIESTYTTIQQKLSLYLHRDTALLTRYNEECSAELHSYYDRWHQDESDKEADEKQISEMKGEISDMKGEAEKMKKEIENDKKVISDDKKTIEGFEKDKKELELLKEKEKEKKQLTATTGTVPIAEIQVEKKSGTTLEKVPNEAAIRLDKAGETLYSNDDSTKPPAGEPHNPESPIVDSINAAAAANPTPKLDQFLNSDEADLSLSSSSSSDMLSSTKSKNSDSAVKSKISKKKHDIKPKPITKLSKFEDMFAENDNSSDAKNAAEISDLLNLSGTNSGVKHNDIRNVKPVKKSQTVNQLFKPKQPKGDFKKDSSAGRLAAMGVFLDTGKGHRGSANMATGKDSARIESESSVNVNGNKNNNNSDTDIVTDKLKAKNAELESNFQKDLASLKALHVQNEEKKKKDKEEKAAQQAEKTDEVSSTDSYNTDGTSEMTTSDNILDLSDSDSSQVTDSNGDAADKENFDTLFSSFIQTGTETKSESNVVFATELENELNKYHSFSLRDLTTINEMLQHIRTDNFGGKDSMSRLRNNIGAITGTSSKYSSAADVKYGLIAIQKEVIALERAIQVTQDSDHVYNEMKAKLLSLLNLSHSSGANRNTVIPKNKQQFNSFEFQQRSISESLQQLLAKKQQEYEATKSSLPVILENSIDVAMQKVYG